jgi:transcriptional regulator with XRE-family HTH domain
MGLTQEKFGKLFDPPAAKSIVSRWEKGTSVPSPERLKKLSELGKVSIKYLTTGKKSDNARELGISVIKKYNSKPLNDAEVELLHESELETKTKLREEVTRAVLQTSDFFLKEKINSFASINELFFSGTVSNFLNLVEKENLYSSLPPLRDLINKYIAYLNKEITLEDFQNNVNQFKNSILDINKK